jgi:hypothetical protein
MKQETFPRSDVLQADQDDLQKHLYRGSALDLRLRRLEDLVMELESRVEKLEKAAS